MRMPGSPGETESTAQRSPNRAGHFVPVRMGRHPRFRVQADMRVRVDEPGHLRPRRLDHEPSPRPGVRPGRRDDLTGPDDERGLLDRFVVDAGVDRGVGEDDRGFGVAAGCRGCGQEADGDQTGGGVHVISRSD